MFIANKKTKFILVLSIFFTSILFSNSLSLEEVIALKLELSTRSLRGKFYGFPIWKSLPELTRDAVLKYALSATRSKKEAARFLGITVSELNKNLKQFKTESFFVNGDGI